jgi:hypothetical protein
MQEFQSCGPPEKGETCHTHRYLWSSIYPHKKYILIFTWGNLHSSSKLFKIHLGDWK